MKIFQTLFITTLVALLVFPTELAFAAKAKDVDVKTIKARQAKITEPAELVEEIKQFNEFVDERLIEVNPDEQRTLRLYSERLFSKKGKAKYPQEAKCTKWDGRKIHGCWEVRAFDPSARVYFDTGSDDPSEVDIFDDGEIGVSLDVISFYLPWKFTRNRIYDRFRLGPLLAFGLTSPADAPEEPSSGDEEEEVSGAPVAYFSGGVLFDYRISEGNSVGFETGYAIGFSADEGFDDNDDVAIYVGFKVNLSPFKI